MTATQQNRVDRLMPGGVPRYVRIYDAGSEYQDRYTIVYSGAAVAKACGGEHPYTSLTRWACSYHGSCDEAVDSLLGARPPVIGRKNHLGRRIAFAELPECCKEFVLEEYKEYWSIPQPKEEI